MITLRRKRVPNPELRDWTLTPERMAWLTLSLLLVLVPHALRVPVWVTAAFLVFAGWRLANALFAVRLPPSWLVALISLALLPGVYATYGTLLGRSAGVALLVILGGMKLIETRALRDALVIGFLGYFLVITNFLYSQSIFTGAFMVVASLVTTATLVALAVPGDELRAAARVRLAGTLLAQAVPVMLVLFVLFPRVSAPLWGLPKDAHAGSSGLSDSMHPGTISRLSLSGAVAFRVQFDGDMPPLNRLYWRGPVLSQTDGKAWWMGVSGRSERPIYVPVGGQPVDYAITLEPHRQKWLFALDVPTTIPPGAQMTGELQLRSRRRVRERIRYEVRSYVDYRLSHHTSEQIEEGLALPPGRHSRAVALARKWRRELASDQAVAERALEYFSRQPFFYTLTPPLMESDPVDEFLFETRRGFCENYASAFTILMRAAGIPARVVTGYQGGEVNPLGNYLLVRQRDAHAWTEVWLGERGWVRMDPTAAVSPERIEVGMDAEIPPTLGPSGLGFRPSEPVVQLWRRMRQSWDAANMRWNQWVLGYGSERQHELLSRFGINADDYAQVALALFVAIGILLGAVAGWLAYTRRPWVDPVLRQYRRFCRKLGRRGLIRGPAEGPIAFAERIRGERPDLDAAVREITELYVSLRYRGAGGSLAELRSAITALRV